MQSSLVLLFKLRSILYLWSKQFRWNCNYYMWRDYKPKRYNHVWHKLIENWALGSHITQWVLSRKIWYDKKVLPFLPSYLPVLSMDLVFISYYRQTNSQSICKYPGAWSASLQKLRNTLSSQKDPSPWTLSSRTWIRLIAEAELTEFSPFPFKNPPHTDWRLC